MKTFALQVLRTDSNVNKRSRGRGTNGIIKIFKEEKEKKKAKDVRRLLNVWGGGTCYAILPSRAYV